VEAGAFTAPASFFSRMAEGSQLAVANARVRRHAIRCDATSASSPRRFAENFPLRVGQRTAERVAGLRLHKTGTLDATEELRLTHGGEFRRWCRDAEQSSEVVVVTRGDDPLTIGRWSNCASPPACTARVHRPRAPPACTAAAGPARERHVRSQRSQRRAKKCLEDTQSSP